MCVGPISLQPEVEGPPRRNAFGRSAAATGTLKNFVDLDSSTEDVARDAISCVEPPCDVIFICDLDLFLLVIDHPEA
jgi:hypothetical protein